MVRKEVLLSFVMTISLTFGFQNNYKSILRHSSPSSSLHNTNNNNDDDFYEPLEEQQAGQALAHEFYEQLKIRQMRNQLESSEKKGPTIMKRLDEEEESWNSKKMTATNKKPKFTGRQGEIDSTGTPSAGLFAQSNGSVYGFPVERRSGKRSVQEQMMRSEFNLVTASERSILIQLSLALTLLAAVLYVGLTGGITDGSERFLLPTDDLNEITQTILNNNDSSTTTTTTDATIMNEIIRTSQTGSIWL